MLPRLPISRCTGRDSRKSRRQSPNERIERLFFFDDGVAPRRSPLPGDLRSARRRIIGAERHCRDASPFDIVEARFNAIELRMMSRESSRGMRA